MSLAHNAEISLTDDDLRPEIENRIRNLFWTVSGDYSAQLRPDVDTFLRSKPLGLYDAVKQGAFQRHFDTAGIAEYTLKKRALGAEGELLTELTRLCVDAAAYPLVSAERSGIRSLRMQAFWDLLRLEQFSDRIGALRRCIICRFLNQPDSPDPEILAAAEKIEALEHAGDTASVIAVIDEIYNTLLDPSFREKHSLEDVLSVTRDELLRYQHDLSVDDETMQAVLEDYLKNLADELLRTKNHRPAPRRAQAPVLAEAEEENIPEPSPEDRERVYAFMERQFGKSRLPRGEQERISRRLCTGIHRRCSLYYTDGILKNPAVQNTQFLRTRMQSMKNEMYFNMKQLAIRRSVNVLSAMLRQVQVMQMDEDAVRSEYGQIVPSRLWKVGRTSDSRLFDLHKKRESSGFAVDLLLDSSSSQIVRQPQLASQAFIISRALTNAGIPHRVTGFCSYWDYTMLHRFRDYSDGPEADRNILQFRAFGENRDGLAIRAVCSRLQERPEENRILIILSDGRPNNLGSTRPGTRKPVPYVGEAALRDTAFEVRRARNQGIRVLGVFVGDEEDLPAEKRIFGKDFTYTKKISAFAHIVGRYLRRLMEQDGS